MHTQFKKWLTFLRFTNEETENCELLTNYFFNQFGQHPKQFFEFLHALHKYLNRGASLSEKKLLAQKYLIILSPLAERFGFFKLKHLLDDLCFKMVHPNSYAAIEKLLVAYKKKSDKLTTSIIGLFEETLKKNGYRCEVKGRYKNIYSISRKLLKKPKKTVLNLNDIFAFRIIAQKNDPRICFEILNLFHDLFSPIVSFFKDYITIPKVNGYQSLHTGLSDVMPELSLPIEVQIRTRAMDDFAEKGVAAHWIYAEHKKARLVSEKEQKLLHYLSTVSKNTAETSLLYFFSHKGDIFRLDQKSTALDFAYHIHTELGHRMKGAIVKGMKKPLWYKIREGDAIKILTGARNQVTQQFLKFTQSHYARKKIGDYLRHHAVTATA